MKSLIDTLKGKESFVSLKGASAEDIASAEQSLNVRFAQDYHNYVSAFGAASYYGHELTGVCRAKSLDVVGITISEREFNEVPEDWYVIEQTHVDGIVFWQAADGKIYRTAIKKKAIKVCDSLLEYIDLD